MLAFIGQFIREKGYPPSIREIGKACGISSTSVVKYNLNILQREGHIRRDPEVSRGIELIQGREQDHIVRVPLLGQIAAGQPIPVPTEETWATYNPSDMVEVPQELARGRKGLYALRVKGTSMVDALIGDGDLVLMQAAQTAENGEMVAVWLRAERETTLKRFYLEADPTSAHGGRVRLQPANAEMAPIYVDADNVEIQGKVVGVIRRI
jgi:repressor LexA